MTIQFEQEAVGSASLEKLREVGAELLSLESQYDRLEQDASATKSLISNLKIKVLPDMMAEIGILDFTMEDGTKITINDFTSGTIPADMKLRELAMEYLISIGGGDLIKTFIELAFAKSDHEQAAQCAALLKKHDFQFVQSQSVHAGSLGAFVKDKLRNGEPIDPARLGIYVGRTAKVKGSKR